MVLSMKTIVAILIPFCLACLHPIQGAEEDQKAVTVRIDVPNPGWKIDIIGLHLKDNKLLVVSRASHSGGPSAQVISKAESKVMTDAAKAELPRKHYLLGREWNWGKGYTAISEDELKALVKDAESVEFSTAEEAPTEEDFIGLTVEEAVALADKHSLRHRVVMVDGKPRPTTRDHRPERLNFTVVDGKVTSVSKG